MFRPIAASDTKSGQIHIVQNQEKSAPHTTYILVNNHKKQSGPMLKDSIIWHHFECATQRREDYMHTHQEQELPDTRETEKEY